MNLTTLVVSIVQRSIMASWTGHGPKTTYLPQNNKLDCYPRRRKANWRKTRKSCVMCWGWWKSYTTTKNRSALALVSKKYRTYPNSPELPDGSSSLWRKKEENQESYRLPISRLFLAQPWPKKLNPRGIFFFLNEVKTQERRIIFDSLKVWLKLTWNADL